LQALGSCWGGDGGRVFGFCSLGQIHSESFLEAKLTQCSGKKHPNTRTNTATKGASPKWVYTSVGRVAGHGDALLCLSNLRRPSGPGGGERAGGRGQGRSARTYPEARARAPLSFTFTLTAGGREGWDYGPPPPTHSSPQPEPSGSPAQTPAWVMEVEGGGGSCLCRRSCVRSGSRTPSAVMSTASAAATPLQPPARSSPASRSAVTPTPRLCLGAKSRGVRMPRTPTHTPSAEVRETRRGPTTVLHGGDREEQDRDRGGGGGDRCRFDVPGRQEDSSPD
jgi:hypothetical protein